MNKAGAAVAVLCALTLSLSIGGCAKKPPKELPPPPQTSSSAPPTSSPVDISPGSSAPAEPLVLGPPPIERLGVVPRASAVGRMRRPCLSNGGLDLAAVYDRLAAILSSRGYGSSDDIDPFAWFLTPSGFVIATPFERIAEDGSPIMADRWSTAPFFNSTWQVLTRNARPGRYRGFMVSYGTGMAQDDRPGSLQRMQTFVASDGLAMPRAVGARRGGPDHYLQIFVYEYARPSAGTPAVLVRPGLSFETHLAKSGLAARLAAICTR